MKKPQLLITILFVFSLVLSPVSVAQLYKWVDDKGNVHYGDSPPENADLKEITGEVSSFTSVTVEPFEFDPNNITQPKASKSVVMYSTSWCGYCKKAKRHFNKNNIAFKEYDIEKNAQAAREYKKLKGRGVPVILIGKRRMNGFSVQTFDKIYYGS
jgi:glutaredoxin-like YruB-family protein